MQYFKYVNMYQGVKIKGDKYEEKYQFIELAVCILGNLVSGNYINFSLCEYYNDNTFIDLSTIIFSLITMQDHNEFSSFTNLNSQTYKTIECFMKYHSEMMIRRFPPTLLIKIIETTLMGLITETENKGPC